MGPPWSPPRAISASPMATTTALPLEEPPAINSGLRGLRTGQGYEVWEPPEKQRSSQTVLPTISAPASSRRVTTVASTRGTYPSIRAEPFRRGIPARAMLSFRATFLPASGPPAAPLTEHRQAQAPRGFSAGSGR